MLERLKILINAAYVTHDKWYELRVFVTQYELDLRTYITYEPQASKYSSALSITKSIDHQVQSKIYVYYLFFNHFADEKTNQMHAF